MEQTQRSGTRGALRWSPAAGPGLPLRPHGAGVGSAPPRSPGCARLPPARCVVAQQHARDKLRDGTAHVICHQLLGLPVHPCAAKWPQWQSPDSSAEANDQVFIPYLHGHLSNGSWSISQRDDNLQLTHKFPNATHVGLGSAAPHLQSPPYPTQTPYDN